MKNVLGNVVTMTLFGESHGKTIGATLDGILPGILVNEDFIKSQLSKRRPKNKIETARKEADSFQIVSGVFNGYTTGEALTILIENNDIRSKDYDKTKDLLRPGHADYTTYIKSNGYNDYRGGGHTSGRLTAPIVALGAILIDAFKQKNIYIGTHIKKCGQVYDREFNNLEKDLIDLSNKDFPVLNDIENDIYKEIEQVALKNDSIGGILETVIYGLPKGLGEPWFSSVESKLSQAIFGIGAVKGIEFGEGFNFSNLLGSQSNDSFYVENNNIKTKTNHNGGINGGITNGMPVLFRTAIKPTPSIGLPQDTVNINTKENEVLEITGRHDPAIIRRMAVVIDSITAIVLADLLAIRYGNNFLSFEE